jgi:hypothetical protein
VNPETLRTLVIIVGVSLALFYFGKVGYFEKFGYFRR